MDLAPNCKDDCGTCLSIVAVVDSFLCVRKYTKNVVIKCKPYGISNTANIADLSKCNKIVFSKCIAVNPVFACKIQIKIKTR